MRILVASDSFKDGCTSIEACESIAKGILSFKPDVEIDSCPISDGGEGTVEILQHHLGGELVEVEVSNPLFKRIKASYLLMNGVAFIEMAQASGLELLTTAERNPLNTSTFGTGELIRDALDRGCTEIVLSMGGSVTTDLGMGVASALGYRFVDSGGNDVTPIGNNMSNVVKVDSSLVDKRIATISFKVITDVNNPLYGLTGAANVFGAQKGGDEKGIEALDNGLQHLWAVLDNGINPDTPGFGAAGGLAAGCVVFLGASIHSGVTKIAELINLKDKIDQADIIITGEGKLDSQTADGKLISGIAELGKGKKLIAFCGVNTLLSKVDNALNINTVIEISSTTQDLKEVLSQTKENLEKSARLWASKNL